MSQALLKFTSQDQAGEKTEWFEVLPLELLTAADRTSGIQRCVKAQGVMLQVVINNLANTPTYTPTILTPGGDTTIADEVIATFSAISSSGVSMLVMHPTATGIGDSAIAGTLPRDWKLLLDWTGADTTHQADTHVYARYI